MTFLLLGQVAVGAMVGDPLLACRAGPGERLVAEAGVPVKLLGVVVGLDEDRFLVGGRCPVQVEGVADLMPVCARSGGLADVAELQSARGALQLFGGFQTGDRLRLYAVDAESSQCACTHA